MSLSVPSAVSSTLERRPTPISPRVHGMIDYATVAMVAAAPRLLNFPEPAARLCYGLAAGYLALSLATDYPLSAAKVVPFAGHGLAEGAIGAALPAAPWALGFSRHAPARNFLLGLTAVTAVVAALTDWGEGGPGRTRARR